MRKLISLTLALILVLSLSTVAFAAEGDTASNTVTYAPTEATSFNITKTYTSDETFVPGETLSFTIEADDENPDDSMISIGENNTYTVTGLSNTITVTVPSFDTAGVYEWTIEEVEGNTAGVTSYDTTKTIYVTALVQYDNDENKLEIENLNAFIKKIDGVKTSEFENVFQTNDFTVAKNVEGNMADKNDEFEITVTLTSSKPVLTDIEVGGETVAATAWTNSEGTYTYTKTLSLCEADAATAFNNIPYGVQVSVTENTDATKMNGYTHDGYTVNGIKGTTASFTIDDTEDTTDVVVVENTKTADVDTGISLDNMPYILMLGFCTVAAVLFVTKRRAY